MNSDVDKYANLLEIVKGTQEKHLHVLRLMDVVEMKEEHERAEIKTTLGKLKEDCARLRKLLILEQDLGKHFLMSKDGELSAVREQSIDMLRMLGVIEDKALSPKYEYLAPEIAALRKELAQGVCALQEQHARIFRELSEVFYLLYQLMQRNQEQAGIFGTGDYEKFVASGSALASSMLSEMQSLHLLVRMFKNILRECAQDDRETFETFYHLNEHRHALAALEALSLQHFVMPIAARDEKTMGENLRLELPLIETAERLDMGMMAHGAQAGERIRASLGAEWALLRSEATFNVHWDTIPVVRTDVLLLVRYVARKWQELFLKRIPLAEFVKLTIVGASRTREVQEQLQRISVFATSAERSMHVRGLAIDWGTLTIANEIVDKILKVREKETKWKEGEPSPMPTREHLMDQINLLLEEIVTPLAEAKINGHPLVVPIRESHGCFHMSVNPDPDALQELARRVA